VDGHDLPGFSGRPESVAALAAAWAGHGWPQPELHMALGMYELTAVKAPTVPGRFRAATEADVPLLTAWMTAFHIGLHEPLDAATIEANTRIRLPRIGLWEDNGQPVSTALSLPPAAGVARIGAVYTPPEQRRRGYASAVTATVSQRALESGAHTCMLYTDLANPTSNAIYQAIGYRRVGDSEVRRFPAAGL
jgi:predicted GNAT family acetyltransferase